MKKLAVLFVAVMVCGVALIGWMIWNDHRQLEREVTSQFDISPRFAEMAKQCEEKVPCKDDVQIAFVQSISTLADAAKAYELAEGNCVFGEVRSMVELRSEQLLWPALSEARSFEEHAELLPLAKNTRYLHALAAVGVRGVSFLFGLFGLIRNSGPSRSESRRGQYLTSLSLPMIR